MDCIELLRELIRIDTTNPPGNEKEAAEYLSGVLEPFGFSCRVQDLGDNRANLIAVLEGGEGPELMLNGHLDVVPASGDWKTPPFQLTARGDKLYGRGAADMKGGIAAMCEAAVRAARTGALKRGRLKLLFVADEECSNLGTLSYLEENPGGRYAVIGEPTGLRVAIAHRGVSRDYIDIRGESRHAALAPGTEDAVSGAALAIRAVEAMNRELKAMRHEVLPPPGVAVTMIQGYEKDNIVPGSVRLLLDFRLLPGMSQEQAENILDEGFRKAGLTRYERTLHFYMPGGEISSRDEFVKLCVEEGNRLLKKELPPCAFDASCEQCFLVERGIKAVICGPGDISQAHTADEFSGEREIRAAADLYERIIRRVLG